MMRTLSMAAALGFGFAADTKAVETVEPPQCKKDTGGTCFGTGICYDWRGPSYCSADSRCLCKEGYCTGEENVCTITKKKEAAQIAAQKKIDCSQDTSGSCALFGCSTWRGETTCVKDYPDAGFPWNIPASCICKPGYCSYDAKCVAADEIDVGVLLAAAPTTELRGAESVANQETASQPMPVALDAVKVDPGQWDKKQTEDVKSPGLAVAAIILVPLLGLPCMIKCKNGNLQKLC